MFVHISLYIYDSVFMKLLATFFNEDAYKPPYIKRKKPNP